MMPRSFGFQAVSTMRLEGPMTRDTGHRTQGGTGGVRKRLAIVNAIHNNPTQ